jgi:SWIM zinc finger
VIELSIARRVHRGLGLWRNQGAEIRPIPAGGLSVPSCSEPGRIYRVSLAGEGRCSCADWRHRTQSCKHIYAALIWVATPGARPGGAAAGGLTWPPPPSRSITVYLLAC